MFYVLDAGHGSTTKGKCSPDGRFKEYEYNREIARRVGKKLEELGISYAYTYELNKPYDLGLSKRAYVANEYAREFGAGNVLLISIHSNAFGDGNSWTSPAGWEVYTTKGKTNSDKYATIFWEAADDIWRKKYCRIVRKDYQDGDPDYEENFTVIYKTICPSLLIEEGFYTNWKEMEWLLTEEGKTACVEVIVEAIKRIEGISE